VFLAIPVSLTVELYEQPSCQYRKPIIFRQVIDRYWLYTQPLDGSAVNKTDRIFQHEIARLFIINIYNNKIEILCELVSRMPDNVIIFDMSVMAF